VPVHGEAACKRAFAAAALHRCDGDDRSRHLQYPWAGLVLGTRRINPLAY
jgi:hypothetical protein